MGPLHRVQGGEDVYKALPPSEKGSQYVELNNEIAQLGKPITNEKSLRLYKWTCLEITTTTIGAVATLGAVALLIIGPLKGQPIFVAGGMSFACLGISSLTFGLLNHYSLPKAPTDIESQELQRELEFLPKLEK